MLFLCVTSQALDRGISIPHPPLSQHTVYVQAELLTYDYSKSQRRTSFPKLRKLPQNSGRHLGDIKANTVLNTQKYQAHRKKFSSPDNVAHGICAAPAKHATEHDPEPAVAIYHAHKPSPLILS